MLYTARHDIRALATPLWTAVLAALAASGCCSSEIAVSCLENVGPTCPTIQEASDLLSVDEVTSEGVYYPERRYVDGSREIVEPAS